MSACGGDADVLEQSSSDRSSAETETADEVPPDEQGAIVESGLGQSDDQYVWVTALVENKSDHAGQTATVSFNIKDESGEVVATVEQVEGFGWPGQMLALGTQADLDPGVRAASVEATLLIQDDNTFATTDALDTAEAEFVADEFGGKEARYTVTNPTDTPLENPRIGVICKDADGQIHGGGSGFPTLVPPSGEIKLATYLIVSSDQLDARLTWAGTSSRFLTEGPVQHSARVVNLVHAASKQ